LLSERIRYSITGVLALSIMDSKRIRRVHKASMAGIIASFAYLAAGLVAAALRAAADHVFMMAGGVLVGFVVAVESSYVVSPMRAKRHTLMGAAYAGLLAAPLVALVAPPVGVLLGMEAWAWILVASLAVETLPAFVGAALSRGTVRASLAAAGFSDLLAAVYLALAALRLPGSPVLIGLGLLYAFPVPMIFSVSLHAFPSTYGRRPLWPLLPLPFALTAASSLGLALAGRVEAWVLLAAALSLVTYLPAVRIHEAPRIAREIASSKLSPIVVNSS
jgi:MFS family permease